MMTPAHEHLKVAAVKFMAAFPDVFLNREHGEVALIVCRPKEFRQAMTTPEEAAAAFEVVAKRSIVDDLRRDPAEFNAGAAGLFWVVAVAGNIAVYFPVAARRGPTN